MALVADVRVTDHLDRLVVTPRDPRDGHALSGTLARALPNVRLHRSADGVGIGAQDAELLRDAALPIDLRWTAEARLFAENRALAKRLHASLYDRVARVLEGGRAVAEGLLVDVDGLGVLDDHQWVNVAAMTLEESYGLCVFDEQGAGKTVTLIHAFDVLVARDEVDFALIIAPKSMVAEWPQDFRRFKGDLYQVVTVTGSRREKRRALAAGADVVVTNFETAVSMEDELRSLLRRFQGRAMVVIDESFYIKNLDAQRTRALRRLREWCRRAFVLCGTPAPNAPHDLVQQFNLVDFGLTFAGLDVPEDRDAARPVVQQAIETRGLFVRHLKKVVLPDLPTKRFHRVILPLEPVQRRCYEAALRDLVLDLRSTSEQEFQRNLVSFLARRTALLQICANPIALVGGYDEVPAKQRALDALLVDLVERRREKVVLWSFFTASIDGVMSRYARFNPVRYDGTVADIAMRREAVRRFQEDEGTMLFVANPAAAGAGLTLHRARYAVYESLSNQAAHYLQSLDRVHRRGQTRDVEYVVLLCDGTIEVNEYERLIDKERAAQELLGDHVDEPMTRESMLADLTTPDLLLEPGPQGARPEAP